MKNKLYKLAWECWIPLCLFLALLYKNPFSVRSLIPNFEPYPDSFHYILPARCFITQGIWKLCRPEELQIQGVSPDVGPGYSMTLIPFFLLYNDPRMFYFANVTLALISFYLLYQIIMTIQRSKIVTFCILIVYVISYHLIWFTTLPMAENLLICLFILNSFLLLRHRFSSYPLVASLASIALYATKYAYVPLSGIFWLAHAYIIFQSNEKAERKKSLFIFFILSFIAALLLISPSTIWQMFSSSFFTTGTLEETVAQHTWFSLSFMKDYLPRYTQAVLGKPILVLWDTRPFINSIFALLGCLGFVVGVLHKKTRLFASTISLALIGQLLFISTFYSFDGRYILPVIPALLIGLALFTHFFLQHFPAQKMLIIGSLAILVLVSTAFQASRLKLQLALNFKYAETPWYFIATQKIDSELPQGSIIITALPPYFFDFFSHKDFTVLPLAPEQERKTKPEIYGSQYSYDDLIKLYKQLFLQNKEMYVTNASLGNSAYMHEAYDRVNNNFELQPISEGCIQTCNIFKIVGIKSDTTSAISQ